MDAKGRDVYNGLRGTGAGGLGSVTVEQAGAHGQ